ncbi:MAG TPA: flagellar basal body-associated FliL family protein [Bacillota bacterium]
MNETNRGGGGKQMIRKLLPLVLVVVLAGAAGAGAGYWVINGAGKGSLAAAREVQPSQPGPMFPLGSLMTNLSDQGRPRFIQVSLELEAADEATLAQLTARAGAVRDAVLRVLRATSAAELEAADGMAGLAERLRAAVNDVLDAGEVRQVYFQELIVQ